MAKIENPRKQFNFSVQIVGLPINPFLVQEFDAPEEGVETATHGDTNHDIKTGGRKTVGQARISKLSTTDGSDNYFWDWMASIADAMIGGGLPPNMYKRTLLVTEFAEDGASIINTWTLIGSWPSKKSQQEWKRASSDNSLEEIFLEVDRVEKI